jgi:hypothetical protein
VPEVQQPEAAAVVPEVQQPEAVAAAAVVETGVVTPTVGE